METPQISLSSLREFFIRRYMAMTKASYMTEARAEKLRTSSLSALPLQIFLVAYVALKCIRLKRGIEGEYPSLVRPSVKP
ncbi:hypothetical protein L596_027199 [Steinernema carpocapsae]|uniref:Uncharacterized protein n=1 Tax=Steinernema carpocapsae TaxID=34508 RepID=A0A4U5M3M1_STECR|nr:hypothetical protein L596_027199 [Steinernema carpocapsae]